MSDFLFGDKRPVILTVDDDEMNLLLMKRIFAKDADIICLNSGSKALEWLADMIRILCCWIIACLRPMDLTF